MADHKLKQDHKVKVLRIISRLNIGGPTVHVTFLTAGLNSRKYKSVLVSGIVGACEGDMSYFALEHGVKPITIPELGREIGLKNDLITLYKLVKLIRTEKPDLVDTHTAKAGAIGRIAAILCGVSFKVHTFHGHIFHGYFSKFKTKLYIFIERMLARFTDRIIVLSPRQFQELCHQIKIASPEKFSIVPLGFELDKFLNAEIHKGKLRRELDIPEDTMLVGIAGRLTAIKNHALFLRSALRILESKHNVKFVIVGDGELASELKGLASNLKIEDKVIFLGWRSDMHVVYADLDIVALSSLNEGTPVTLIEAMASAKPIVATAVGGVPDIVIDGETGILVPTGDDKKLAEAILTMIIDPEKRKEFGARGREFVRERFTKERLIADIERLYEKVVSTKCRGTAKNT